MQNPSPAGPAPRTRLARLGGLIARHPRSWVAAWAVIAIACFAVAVAGVTGESLFERLHSGAPTVESESSRAQDVIAQSQPALETLTMQVTGADLTDAAAVDKGAAATREIARVPGVKNVRSPLLSPNGLSDPSVVPLVKGGNPAAGGFVTVVDFEPGLSKAAQSDAESQAEQRMLAVPSAMGARGRSAARARWSRRSRAPSNGTCCAVRASPCRSPSS